MPLLLFAIWLLLNGRLALDVMVSGAMVVAAVSLCAYRFLDYSPRRDWLLLRQAPRVFLYLLRLVGSVIAANLTMARIILSPRAGRVRPALAVFDVPVKTRSGRLLLANSITLTPGTVTAGLKGGRLCVHGLDRELLEGLEDSSFVRQIRRMEGGEDG